MADQREDERDLLRMCRSIRSNMSIMEFEGLGSEYYVDDCDKEFDIPIDPVWEARQIHTFTAWCNAHLRKANMKIEVFEQDFKNGLKLMKLLEIISNDVLPPPDKGKMRFHKIANVNKALKFIEEKGVKIDSVGAEEIVDGNIKMTLGMIWTIILRFTIQDIQVEDSSAKEGLLLWCKRKTNGYKNIRVDNFKNSFQNGLAFCALIHSHDPRLIDYDNLSPNNARDNLNLAFTVADTNLDVPQMLSVDDMIDNEDSDERSIMAYVSSYYHAFNRKDKVDAALANINGIISAKMEESKYALDYEKLADDLEQWIDMVSREFQDCGDIDDNSVLISRVKWFEQYKFLDKPKNSGCHMKIQFETVNNAILREKDNIIRMKWSKMEQLECIFEKHLSDQRHRQEHISNLLGKFEINYQFQREWINEQMRQLLSKDYETSNLCQLRTLSRLQDMFMTTVGSQQTRTDKLVSIAKELRRLRYHDMDTIDRKIDLIIGPWDSLGNLNDQRIRSINIYLNALTQIDDLQLDFASRVTVFYNWIQQANQDLNDKFILHFIEEIQDLIIAQESFKKTVSEAIEELHSVHAIEDRILRIIDNSGINQAPQNPYTDITFKDVEKAWIQLEKSIIDRDNFLRESLEEQVYMRDCHSDYVQKATRLMAALRSVQQSLYGGNVDPEIPMMKSLQGQLNSMAADLRELNTVVGKLDTYRKLDDSVSLVSFEQIVIVHDILGHLIAERLRDCSMDKTDGRLCNDLPQNKIHEFEACFRHFDRNNSGQLDSKQFKACLVSLGFALEDDKSDNGSFEKILAEVDPEHTGKVTLRRYLDFMNRQNSDKCSRERLLESFRILSNNQPWISRDTIRQQLPSPVAHYCLKNMNDYNLSHLDPGTCLDYNDFVTRLYHRPPTRLWNGSMQ